MSFGSRSLPPPTADQERRWGRIAHVGCIACLSCNRSMPAEIHHLTVGGKHGAPRLGHEFTIGLCSWHHRGTPYSDCDGVWTADLMEFEYGPSFAKTPRAFRNWFGPDEALLKLQNELIGWPVQRPEQRDRAGRRSKQRSRCTAAANQVRRDPTRLA